jgi:hypothetical protein
VVSDAGPGSGPLGRSLPCTSEAHQDCGHVSVGVRGPAPGHRLKSVVALCRCPCHAACPLADRMPVPLTVWQQLCACPGAEKHRAWKEDADEPWPGAKEYGEKENRKSRERSEARRQAFRAARDAAPGKSRDEVRDLYIAELLAQGQEAPPEPLLEATVDLLIGQPWRGLMKMWQARPKPFSDL